MGITCSNTYTWKYIKRIKVQYNTKSRARKRTRPFFWDLDQSLCLLTIPCCSLILWTAWRLHVPLESGSGEERRGTLSLWTRQSRRKRTQTKRCPRQQKDFRNCSQSSRIQKWLQLSWFNRRLGCEEIFYCNKKLQAFVYINASSFCRGMRLTEVLQVLTEYHQQCLKVEGVPKREGRRVHLPCILPLPSTARGSS